jgi:hypothetical protein
MSSSIDELYSELDFSQDKMFELEQRIDNVEHYVKTLLLLQICNGSMLVKEDLLKQDSSGGIESVPERKLIKAGTWG